MDFNKNKYKIYTWKNWMTLHWILNPGLVINELILGQRVPRISLEDKTVAKPRIERIFIPCPHCKTLHDGRTWSTQNTTGYKNWFGLYCSNCQQIIPCVINILSLIILTLTFPIWGWFSDTLKKNWLKNQPKRFKNLDLQNTPNPFDKKNWIKTGLIWGIIMFTIMSVLFSYLEGTEITFKTFLINLITWTIGGIFFSYSMKLFYNSKIKS